MKKIMLVNLPWKKNGCSGVRAGSRWPHIKDAPENNYLPFPFFLSYAASLLKKNGYDVFLLDAICLKMHDNEFIEAVKLFAPDVLVVETSSITLDYDVRYVSRLTKNFKLVLCGPSKEITTPDFLKKNGIVDFAISGEYEFALLDLINTLQGNDNLAEVKGITYRGKNDVFYINPARELGDINSLPWPMREGGLKIENYIDSPGAMPFPTAQMVASRGCPYGCLFCLWPQVMYGGNNYRVRNPEDVLDEMEMLVHQYKFKSIYFDDDTFGLDKNWLNDFCDGLIERNREHRINVPWAMMTRPDLMTEDILCKLKNVGLWAVKYGFESANQELVNNIGKNLNVEYAKKMIKCTHLLGIKTHLTFTFGLPGETKQTIKNTIKTVLELEPFSVQFSITTPFPGTKYYEYTKEKGMLLSNKFSDYDGNLKSVIKTEALSPWQLKKARDYAYKVWNFHLRKKRLRRKAVSLKNKIKNFKCLIKEIILASKKTILRIQNDFITTMREIKNLFVSFFKSFIFFLKTIKNIFIVLYSTFFYLLEKKKFFHFLKLLFVVYIYNLYLIYRKLRGKNI